MREGLRRAGERVRREAAMTFAEKYNSVSARGFRVVVRTRGISVEQSLRKVTGDRPDYGAIQVRDALIPARDRNEEHIHRVVQEELDKGLRQHGF